MGSIRGSSGRGGAPLTSHGVHLLLPLLLLLRLLLPLLSVLRLLLLLRLLRCRLLPLDAPLNRFVQQSEQRGCGVALLGSQRRCRNLRLSREIVGRGRHNGGRRHQRLLPAGWSCRLRLLLVAAEGSNLGGYRPHAAGGAGWQQAAGGHIKRRCCSCRTRSRLLMLLLLMLQSQRRPLLLLLLLLPLLRPRLSPWLLPLLGVLLLLLLGRRGARRAAIQVSQQAQADGLLLRRNGLLRVEHKIVPPHLQHGQQALDGLVLLHHAARSTHHALQCSTVQQRWAARGEETGDASWQAWKTAA